ncbi:MAG: GT4 family glycosyltransferase PelF [Ilumatobacteraceae bacterium]
MSETKLNKRVPATAPVVLADACRPTESGRVIVVSLITEGTYPFHDGGVSVWCDQLLRGMSTYEFQVDAITATASEGSSWDLPANVSAVRTIPLWGPTGTHRPLSQLKPEVRDALRWLLHDITSPTDVIDFQISLQRLLPYAQQGTLRASLLSKEAVGLTLDALTPHAPTGRRVDTLATRPTVADAIACLRTLEHLLRPLCVPPPMVDLCHASSNGIGVLLAMTAKWINSTPFLLTEHGLYLRERYIANSPAAIPHHQRAFLLGFYKQLTAAAYQMADVIAPGSEYNRYWEQANGADPAKIRPIYNGIDAPNFSVPSGEPDVPTLAWVGRIDPLKDVFTMLRAFAIVRAALPDARLRLFGGTPKGNDQYLRACLDLRKHLGLEDSAVFEGRIPSITDGYHAGHVVVSTSISEGFPYSILEAMASGRPMVATDVGGVSEAIGDVGIMTQPRNHRAIAAACLQLLSDPARRADLAMRGRKRVLDLFTLGVCLARYSEIYTALTTRCEDEAAVVDGGGVPISTSRHLPDGLVGAIRAEATAWQR